MNSRRQAMISAQQSWDMERAELVKERDKDRQTCADLAKDRNKIQDLEKMLAAERERSDKVRVCVYACMYVCVYILTCTCNAIHIHIHIHINTHAFTYTYIHTPAAKCFAREK